MRFASIPWLLLLALLLFFVCAPAGCGGDDDDDGGDNAPDAGAPDGGGGDAGPVKLCGGLAGISCAESDYCDYEEDNCGEGDFQGVCRPRPTSCEPDVMRVCGCDNMAYDNKCLAAMAGWDFAEIGLCKGP